jgi:hypothetical protein
MVPLKFRKQVLMQILKKTVQPAKLSAVNNFEMQLSIIEKKRKGRKGKGEGHKKRPCYTVR